MTVVPNAWLEELLGSRLLDIFEMRLLFNVTTAYAVIMGAYACSQGAVQNPYQRISA